jgi:pimeloyl-ACP methyl ester carboxylesterase
MPDPAPPLVLLPGLAGDTSMWRAQLPVLAARRHTMVADVHERFDSIEAMASGLLTEQQGAMILCGASMGGMLAMETARQAPHRVRAMALLGTNARPETEDMRALREAAIALFERGLMLDVLRANVPLAFHSSRVSDTALVQEYLDFVVKAGAAQLVRQNRAVIHRPDARTHLPGITCPVLVLCGDEDQLTPPECSREIAALIPHAELRIVERCGHMLTMERPDEVNAELLGWLTRVARIETKPSPSR